MLLQSNPDAGSTINFDMLMPCEALRLPRVQLDNQKSKFVIRFVSNFALRILYSYFVFCFRSRSFTIVHEHSRYFTGGEAIMRENVPWKAVRLGIQFSRNASPFPCGPRLPWFNCSLCGVSSARPVSLWLSPSSAGNLQPSTSWVFQPETHAKHTKFRTRTHCKTRGNTRKRAHFFRAPNNSRTSSSLGGELFTIEQMLASSDSSGKRRQLLMLATLRTNLRTFVTPAS